MDGIVVVISLGGLVFGVMVAIAVLNTSHRIKLMLDQSKAQTLLLKHLVGEASDGDQGSAR